MNLIDELQTQGEDYNTPTRVSGCRAVALGCFTNIFLALAIVLGLALAVFLFG